MWNREEEEDPTAPKTRTMDEEALIAAVIRVRLEGETPKQVHEKLVGEGLECSAGDVKKACSKASKRGETGIVVAQPPAAEAAPPVESKRAAKMAAAKEQQKLSEIKAAEQAMMEAQRLLKAKKTGDPNAAITIDGTAEAFIQRVTARALSAALEPGDKEFLKERIDADIAALEWVKLSAAAGALKLSEDIVALGNELQLQRLKDVRENKWDLGKALACYARTDGPADSNDYRDVDKLVARSAESGENALDEND